MSVQSATIRKKRCDLCKEWLIGTFLFIWNHEKNCEEITIKSQGRKFDAVKSSYGIYMQNDNLQGNQTIKKYAR